MALVLGVDSSTQSTKVELRDADTGTIVGRGHAAHPPTAPPRSEQDPAVWWNALVTAVAAARAGADAAGQPCSPGDVAAVAVAGQQHGLVALDTAGGVLRPAKLWNDTESAPQAARLVAERGAAGWAEACGSVPVASFTVTKLAWLADHEPAVLDALGTVLLPHDWLTFGLTGRRATDRGDASGTGYWSPADGGWRPDLLAGIGGHDARWWAARLPEVLGPTEAAGGLLPGPAEALGVAAGTPVGPGTGDNMAAALGVALRPGDACVSLGTSGTVFAVTTTPTADARGLVAGFADAAGRFLPLVCTLNATKVTDAMARLLGVDLPALDDLAGEAPAGAGGVVLLPYLDGERTPNRPDATGELSGLRADVTRAQLARAAFEGVVCGLLDGLDALADAGVEVGGRLVLVGGGARSARYRQVLADLSGREVLVPDADELVATGACVQAAAVATGATPDEVAQAWGLGSGRPVAPDPGVDVAAVRAAYAARRG